MHGGKVAACIWWGESASLRFRHMQNESFLLVRVVFTGLFIVTLLAGGYMFKNYQKLFGIDPNMPSENGSSRAYTRVQVFLVWIHFVVLSGSFALLLH